MRQERLKVALSSTGCDKRANPSVCGLALLGGTLHGTAYARESGLVGAQGTDRGICTGQAGSSLATRAR